MKEPIKVCHIVGGIVGGGVEQVIANYCAKMPEIHFDLLYQYEPNLSCLKKLNDAGITCIRVPDKKKHPLIHFWTMYIHFRKENYNVIHCHLDWFLNWIVCLCALLAGVKKRFAHHHHVYQEKTLLHKFAFMIFRFLNKLFATHYLACSNQAALNGWGRKAVRSGKVLVLNNAVDLQNFFFNKDVRQAVRSRLNIQDEMCLGHVGRFCYQKNQDFLLDVVKKVYEKNEKIILLLVGDGPDKNRIVNRAESMGLKYVVRFVESQTDISPFYSAMDIFCMPSRWEGLGMVLIEAQINGLPCVVSTFVPESAKISKDFVFFDLSSTEKWTKYLLERKGFEHNNTASVSCFDIEQQYAVLKNFYLD